MATETEKQEVIDKLSGPRYYRITINGYGGESSYMKVTKEAHDFWEKAIDNQWENDLIEYMLNASDDDCEFEDIEDIPPEADFLRDETGYVWPWFESPTEFEHMHGVCVDSAWITVEEVAGEEYDSQTINTLIEGQELQELIDDHSLITDMVEAGASDAPADAEYIAQIYSSEKGTFFEGTLLTYGEFDPAKMKIFTTEYLNGEDTVDSIEYAGEEVDNLGGDTNGKGFSAAVWKKD